MIEDSFISSKSNTSGVNEKDPKWILGVYVAKYGADYEVLSRVIQCESGWKHEGVFGDSNRAYGIAQFHRPTWDLFNKQRNTNLDYYNLDDQLNMISWAFANKYQSHWSCK